MFKVSRLSVCVLLGAMVLTASAAIAGPKQRPTTAPLGQEPVTSVQVGPSAAQATCLLGFDPAVYPVAGYINYIYPPNDAYFTLIDPTTCAACASPAVTALSAHILLNFRAVCSVPVSVAIYGATGDATCYSPDLSNVLCAPFNTNLAPTAIGDWDFSIPIPAGVCISQPAFLKIEFVSALPTACSTTGTIPRFLVNADGWVAGCTQYNIYPGGADDLSLNFPGPINIYLGVDCCNATPTTKHSWGSLKSSYR